MAVVELLRSRRRTVGENTSIDLVYAVTGTMDDESVYTSLLAAAPAYYLGYPQSTIRIEVVDHEVWECTVTYSYSTSSQQGDPPAITETPSISCDISTQTARCYQALDQTGYVAQGNLPAFDFGGAIGFNGESFDGVDYLYPVLSFVISCRKDADDITINYINTVSNLIAKTNSGTFYGFSAGEVLFVALTGSRRTEDEWELSYRFAVSKNKVNLAVNDIVIPSKKGWEYLWACYRHKDDAAAKFTAPFPIAAYVAKIYEDGDFNDLNIGH